MYQTAAVFTRTVAIQIVLFASILTFNRHRPGPEQHNNKTQLHEFFDVLVLYLFCSLKTQLNLLKHLYQDELIRNIGICLYDGLSDLLLKEIALHSF